jgi:hypothetical protein
MVEMILLCNVYFLNIIAVSEKKIVDFLLNVSLYLAAGSLLLGGLGVVNLNLHNECKSYSYGVGGKIEPTYNEYKSYLFSTQKKKKKR